MNDVVDSWMYPVPDDDRRNGSHCPVLMISSEHWSLTKHQAPFRKDFKHHTMKKLQSIKKISNENHSQSQHQHHHHQQQQQHHFSSLFHPFSVTILGSDHLNYCDMLYLSSPILMTRSNYLGTTNPYELNLAKNHLILRFFAASSHLIHSTKQQIQSTQNHQLNSQSNNLMKLDTNELSPLHLQIKSPNHSQLEISSSHNEEVPSHTPNQSITTSYSPLSINQSESSDVERLFRYCHISSTKSPQNSSPNFDLTNNSLIIEQIPEHIRQYLVNSLVDESSLPHCFDDEYFNQINNQDNI